MHYIRRQCPVVAATKKEATSTYWSANLEKQKFGKLTVKERVDDHTKRAIWRCECECGNVCYLPSRYLLSLNIRSCGCDTKSHGELWMRQELQKLNISFQEQYSAPNCISPGNRIMRFDFAIFQDDKVSCLIEINGMQHYSPVKFFGGIKTFQTQKIYDAIKRDYCAQYNIPLISIPYTHINKVDVSQLLQQGENIMKYKIWVDDCRVPPTGYIWFKTVNDTVAFIQEHPTQIEILDLDHDASDELRVFGGDYIQILNFLELHNLNYPIRIHSMNPVGVQNMRAIIEYNDWEEVR